MRSSAVGSSFCSNITWPENNRECLLVKAASLKLWLAAPDGSLCSWNPWCGCSLSQRIDCLSRCLYLFFKVWLESKSSVYRLCSWLCTTGGLCKLEVSQGRSHPKMEQRVRGEWRVTEASIAAQTQPGTDAQKRRRNAGGRLFLWRYRLPLPKWSLLAHLGVSWWRSAVFPAMQLTGVFLWEHPWVWTCLLHSWGSWYEDSGIQYRVHLVWSREGLLLAVALGKSPLGSSLLVWKPKYTVFQRPLCHSWSSELCEVPSNAFGVGKPESEHLLQM